MMGETLLYQTTADGLTIQVVERNGRRKLRFGNSIIQSAISITNPSRLIIRYICNMMLGMLLRPDARRILHIGLGAGTLPKFIHRHFPQTTQDVVECNAEVADISRRFFGLPQDTRMRVYIAEGSEWIKNTSGQYDLVFLDAYVEDGAPDHLRQQDFLENLSLHVKENGWLVSNVWSGDGMFEEQAALWNRMFDHVLQAPQTPIGNVILFGARKPAVLNLQRLSRHALILQNRMPLDLKHLLESMVIVKQTS
ncbi:MAG: fused MFS/spermidine synthase [SAR324 cluster bacterium]|nr:fused MFS/spermidine synthase [SAR324 cluster bacterium]